MEKGRYYPIMGDYKMEYSITYSSFDEDSLEVGESLDSGYEVEPEVETMSEILHMAYRDYGIYSPVSIGRWESTIPLENRDYFEKGISKYFTLHIKNEDGTEISEEVNDFITLLLSEGKFHRDYFSEYFLGGLLGGNDNYNSGRSWTLDHYQHNKKESYEVPMSKRKKAMGGTAEDQREVLQLRIDNLNNLLNVMSDDKEINQMRQTVASLERERDSIKYKDGGNIEWNYWKIEKDDEIIYERTNVASPNIPNGKRISKEEYDYNVKKSYKNGGGVDKQDWYDFDKKMALINLDQIHEYAVKLDKIITEKTKLEDWVKMKITRVEQSMADVKKSLEGWEKFSEGGELVKKQLLHIAKYSKDLLNMVQKGSKLMSWQEGKLAVASEYIDNVYHHLDYQMGNRASDGKYAIGGTVSEQKSYLDNRIKNLNMILRMANEDKKQELRNSISELERERDELPQTMKHGGMVDLFEDYKNIPPKIKSILDDYSEDFEDGNYNGLKKALKEVEAKGYTFEYGLDGSAYGLRPKGVKLNELKGYKDMALGGVTESMKEEIFNNYGLKVSGSSVTTNNKSTADELAEKYHGYVEEDGSKYRVNFDVEFHYGTAYAKGGGVEGHKHVLHIDGQNWFLEKIDSTHFYMSNDPNYRGMAHHIGQHKGETYYEEVREWLKTTYADGGEAGEMEDWMNDAIKDLRSYTDNNDLKIENVYDDDYFLASDGSHEYLVFEDFDEAHEYAVDDVKNNLEENPEYFQRDWLMGHLEAGNFFRDIFDEWNMSYATDIMTEDDDNYPNRLVAEMVEWGLMDNDEAKGEDAEEIANDRMSDFVNALTEDQINQGNDGFTYYIDNFGEEEAFQMALKQGLIDIEGASEDAVNMDGVAHFISSYDGEEIALDGGSYAYRIN